MARTMSVAVSAVSRRTHHRACSSAGRLFFTRDMWTYLRAVSPASLRRLPHPHRHVVALAIRGGAVWRTQQRRTGPTRLAEARRLVSVTRHDVCLGAQVSVLNALGVGESCARARGDPRRRLRDAEPASMTYVPG